MSAQLKDVLSHKVKLCLKGKIVPESCKVLILKLWPNALYYVIKAHGDKSTQWNTAITMYLDLVDSIQPITSVEQFRSLKDRFMSLARNSNNMLLQYHTEEKVEPAIKALIKYYNHALGNASSELDKTKSSSALDKIAKLPANIKPGVWCEIYIDESTPTRRLRLSIINIDNGQLMFVNRNGVKMLEKDAEVFAAELKQGLSKVYKHDSLFTRANSKAEFQKIG